MTTVSTSEDSDPQVFTLRVTLPDVRPQVWRQLEAPSSALLGDVSEMLLIAFDWSGDLRHHFTHDDVGYGPFPDEEAQDAGPTSQTDPDDDLRDEDDVELAELDLVTGSELTYTYGGRQHRISVEDVVAAIPGAVYPHCSSGAGMAPDEETGATRLGKFDEAARQEINLDLAELEIAALLNAPHLPIDHAFSGLFPGLLVGAQMPCDCGEDHGDEAPMMRPYLPLPVETLAAQAGESTLVQQALSLLRWVGSGRKADVDERLGEADLPAAATAIGVDQPSVFTAIWDGAVEADLIEISGGRVTAGTQAAVWTDPGSTAQQRLDSWAMLLSGFLAQRAGDDDTYEPVTDGELVATSAHLFYALADLPMPAAMPALMLSTSLAAADPDDLNIARTPELFAELPGALVRVAHEWVRAGVLSLVTDSHPVIQGSGFSSAQALVDDAVDSTFDLPPAAQTLFKPMLDAIRDSPMVELTTLGRYGLRRILVAHGYVVPEVGQLAELPAELFLDALELYPPDAVSIEAQAWLAARGEHWRDALLGLAQSARSDDPKQGPMRRILFNSVLLVGGPDIAGLLAELAADRWLGALAANVRGALELGPEPTLQQQLWLAVDELSAYLDDDEEAQFDVFQDSDIAELLELPGAMVMAMAVDHPSLRPTLQLVVELTDDKQLAGRLRRALGARPSRRPASTRPAKKRPKKH